MLIADFEKHFLSGFPSIQDHMKKLNYFKKRLDGFIYSGRDTYTKIINDFIQSGKPVQSHHHNLHLKLNQIKEPGFELEAEIDAYSGKVTEAREAMFTKYGIDRLKQPTTR